MGSTLRAAAGLSGPSDRGGSGYRLRGSWRGSAAAARGAPWPCCARSGELPARAGAGRIGSALRAAAGLPGPSGGVPCVFSCNGSVQGKRGYAGEGTPPCARGRCSIWTRPAMGRVPVILGSGSCARRALDALRTSWRLPARAGPGGSAAPSGAAAGLPGPSDRGGSGYRLRVPWRGSAAAWPVILGRVPVILGSGSCARRALDALRTSWRLPARAGPGGSAAPSGAAAGLPGPSDRGGSGYRLRGSWRGSAAAWPVILGRVPVIEGSGSCAPGVLDALRTSWGASSAGRAGRIGSTLRGCCGPPWAL